ncbi:MAG TPA: hypothetical protein VGQ97_02720 [Xanthobacteraceae bacterium]|nr:hypothetical protein [Xanthobacteraceae bacterium]
MSRYALFGLLAALLLLPNTPATAVTAKEKMDTCKFGAEDQKLKGTAKQNFIKKCMANADAPEGKSKKKREK